MPDHKTIISIALPIISFGIIISFLFLTKPATVGFTIIDTNITPIGQSLEADVTLITSPNELIPENAAIFVTLDNNSASLTIKEFIDKTGSKFEYKYGKFEKINYKGYGYTGNYTYKLPLSAFNLNREIQPGEHLLKIQIKYSDLILFEKENSIIIS